MNILTTLLAAQLAAASPATMPAHDVGAVTEDSRQMTLVFVQNDRHTPVTVWVEDAWGDSKLGVVEADGSKSFQFTDRVAFRGNVRLFILSPGRSEETTGILETNPGDRIGLIVPK